MDEASYHMQLHLQMQQQQQQLAYYNNRQTSTYTNTQPPQYNMSIYSNSLPNNSNYINKLSESTSGTVLPPPPSLPPPPPPISRPPLPPPPIVQYTSQPYYQYTQPNFENYSFQNLINQQNHSTVNNYTNNIGSSQQLGYNVNINNSNNQIFYSAQGHSPYQNYQDSNNETENSNAKNAISSVQYSPKKKIQSPNSKANSFKNIDITELKKYIKRMSIDAKKNNNEINENINEDLSKLTSSAVINRANILVPKYVKPKICKSPMLIHLVTSKQIIKPVPQLAVSPIPLATTPVPYFRVTPQPTFIDPAITSSEYANQQMVVESHIQTYENPIDIKRHNKETETNLGYQKLPPPPPLLPQPPSSSRSVIKSRANRTPPSSPYPAPSTLRREPPGPPPPPPNQRPISPPKTPPPIQRNLTTNNLAINRSAAINNSLLNSLLNSSLQSSSKQTHNQPEPNIHNSTYDTNNSFGHNSTMNSTNYVFNNSTNIVNGSFLTNNQNKTNYHAMLVSPNLKTLYDKKEPPPPYPGNIDYDLEINNLKPDLIKMDTDESTFTHKNNQSTSNDSRNTTGTVIRYCSPQAYKFYMEQHAENVLKSHNARNYRCTQLENEMNKVDLPETIKDQMRKLLRQKETNYLRLRRAKMNKSMFEHIKVLGLGAFGQVDLVKKRDDIQRLYAMKILHKSDVFNRNQAAHVKAERDILAQADNEWVVKLYYSFQDEENLYFVMDYVPGGDLMNLLIKLEVFSEELSRFYIGELTCAIESVHNLGFIHRDIKPDNILIDKCGHIKLTDFGLCTGFHWTHNSKYYQMDHAYNRLLEQKLATNNDNKKTSDKRLMAHSLVGTPNYIAPEILSRKGYTKSCDWWSVGVILYEMLVGEPPFRDETALGTQSKVINYKQTLKIPIECELSYEAQDLIFKLCSHADTRLDSNGIKSHSFFKNFDFGPNLRIKPAPYVPILKHPTDTSNFEPVDHNILADRKARLNGINSPRFSPYNVKCDTDERNNYSNNSMLYEFTFRRFFDEAYSSDNLLKYDEKSKASFSSLLESMSQSNEGRKEEALKMTGVEEVTPESQNNEAEIKKLKEEVLLSGPSSLNSKNTVNFLNICQNNQQINGAVDQIYNKLTSSINSNDLKENRNNETAPIFV